MPPLRKRALLRIVEGAIHASGWDHLYLSPLGDHPARYTLYREERSYRVRVYIWNLTHGGKNRPVDEWRIQATGIGRFEAEIGAKTLILGWQGDRGVFVGFDFSHHRNPLGSSPSIQIREEALERATLKGFAPHTRGNDELAIAFRPEFFAQYVENLEALHGCGQARHEIEMLEEIADSSGRLEEGEVTRRVAEARRSSVVSVTRWARAHDFSRRVLNAYEERCAMCGVQLRLLDGAHVLPVGHSESTDQTDNGVALCVTHHRAYDRALVGFDRSYRVGLNSRKVAELEMEDLDGGLHEFYSSLRPKLHVPGDVQDRPSKNLIGLANEVRGWRTGDWRYVGVG